MNNFIRACNRRLSLALALAPSDKCTNNTRRAADSAAYLSLMNYVQLHLSDKVLLLSELKFGRLLLLLTCG
jgi:hypothetical protein